MRGKTLVICKTYQDALHAWKMAQEKAPSFWKKITKYPLALVSIFDYQYRFEIASPRVLIGYKGRTMCFDDFIWLMETDVMKNEGDEKEEKNE